jgi:hypothetical protein
MYRKVFRLYEICRTEEAVLARIALARGEVSFDDGEMVDRKLNDVALSVY